MTELTIKQMKKRINTIKKEIENNDFYDGTDGHRWGDSSKELRKELEILELKLENVTLKNENKSLKKKLKKKVN